VNRVLFLLLFAMTLNLSAKKLLTERRHIPHSIDTSLRVDSCSAESFLIRVTEDSLGRRTYLVNGTELRTKRKIKNSLDYTIAYADSIRRATNGVGIGVGFTIVTVIPFSKLLGVPLWGGCVSGRDYYIDRYNEEIIRRFNLQCELESLYE
jgi:hypothetical protein